MRLRPSALPPSRFEWFSRVIPFVKYHATPRHTIRVRQNAANTCANYCNQAITLRTGDGTMGGSRAKLKLRKRAIQIPIADHPGV